MKRTLLFIACLLASLAMSAQEGLAIGDIQNSDCLRRARAGESELLPTIILIKEGSVLSVQLFNYESTCGTTDFNVTSAVSGGSDSTLCSLNISVVPIAPYDDMEDCICPYNVSFTVRDVDVNSFYLSCWWYKGIVELTEGEPLVLEYKIENVTIDDISFRLLKVMHKALLMRWTTAEKELLIPSEVNYEGEAYTVMGIDKDAFWNVNQATKVIVPKTIRSMDIDYDTIICANPFRECMSLEWIDVEEGCPLFSSVDGVLFAKNKTMLLGYPIASPRESYTVPKGVTYIRSGAFVHNKYLRKLVIQEEVTYLGWHLFNDTKSLEELYIKGILGPECIRDLFDGMDTKVAVYVQPSEVEKYQAVYKGPVYPLPDDTANTDYIPFVKDGKQWHVIRSEFGQGYHFEQYRLSNEEVAKDGKTYMKMYWTEDLLAVVYDAGLLREEDRKVYFFDNDTQKEYLMFDYSLKAGDTYETYSFDEQKTVTYNVLSVGDYREGPDIVRHNYNQAADSMDIHQRYLQKWTVRRTDNGLEKTWIEGVGSLEGPLDNLYDARPVSSGSYLAYVEYNDFDYLPFSFYDTMNKQIHGCNLPTGESNGDDHDRHHHLTYELEGNRLHVYGEVYTQCGPNNYAYFTEEPTDDPLVRKLHFMIQKVEPMMDCMALHHTNFYVPGFDPNMNYIVVDNQGKEHPVINKTPQMSYRPMIEDGKVWKVGAVNSGNPAQWVEYYYFDGDTIIDGKTCKRMMRQRYVNPDFAESNYISQDKSLSYEGAWYEEDQKVYAYKDHQFKLLYDFSANANDTLLIDSQPYVIGPKQTGGIRGFKGVYRSVFPCSGIDTSRSDFWFARWLEGVGSIDGPTTNVFNVELGDPMWFLMSCTVGDEVIYLNGEYEDGATPEEANSPKGRFDFTHVIKTKPQIPLRRGTEQSLYGEYNEYMLGINLSALDDSYLVRITDESAKVVYEKAVNAGNIVALNIDISSYAKGRYTVTVENSQECFTGEFEAQTTGINEVRSKSSEVRGHIYNLQGQRIGSLRKGLNIVNGRKVFVK